MNPHTMLKISVLKVQNPSCLWGRVVEGPDGDADRYHGLLAQMNLFYHDVTRHPRGLKPPASLAEGKVCVVYWSVMKSWCRAVVEAILVDSVSCKARCLLVDHGERLIIAADRIRDAEPDFLRLPFWVRRFHLAGIRPTTLRVSVGEGKAELTGCAQWDSSATLYLHNLLQASTWTEAVLLESESDSTSIELYLTVGDIKICANDELVAKKFAYYTGESVEALDEGDPRPATLSSSVPIQTRNRPAAPTHPPPATSQGPDAVGARDWPTAPSPPQSQQREEHMFPGSQSGSGCDPAAAESDPDSDSSLAAALTGNLSLFRFLKFLNPGHSSCQQAATSEDAELSNRRPDETTRSSGAVTGQEVCGERAAAGSDGRQVRHRADEDSSSSGLAGSGPAEKKWRSEADRARSWLLEWLNPEPLNPEPLNPDPDAADEAVGVTPGGPRVAPTDPSSGGVLVHSALPVEPWTDLDDAPIGADLRQVLQRKQYGALTRADRYSWPAVARGCNVVVVSADADEPLGYLVPLLTHVRLSSAFSCLTSSSGPVAVLLCPGWERVLEVYDLLEYSKIGQSLRPVTLLLGVGKDEAKTVRIPKNCLLLVTTPFSLVRLLSHHCFMFLRIYHLVLDGADQLFSLAPDQMTTILQHFQKVTSSEERTSCPQQLVAVARQWTNPMEGLLTNHMPHACVVVTVPEEAALYGNVQQVVLLSPETNKVSDLLGVLDFSPDVGQKTLIVVGSARDARDVSEAASHRSAFCLVAHEGSTHEFAFVAEQWRKSAGAGCHVILVTTDEFLECLGIRDATCVVHYDFPASPDVFGGRLLCMSHNFRNLTERSDRTGSRPRSVLLISERNARHVVGLLRYLGRTGAPLPPELLSFARGVHAAREDRKTGRPLCGYLKSFGVCRDGGSCPDRHRFVSRLDRSELPAAGVVQVVPLHIKTASLFYGRVVGEEDEALDVLASEMASHFAQNEPGAAEATEGGVYAVREDDVFHRVKILSAAAAGSVRALFIDDGREEEVQRCRLLRLPERFCSPPGRAVEIVVCRVKPVDAEVDWHPKVTRAVSRKIRGLQHRARVVLRLRDTVFVDPMVRLTQVPGTRTVINEYSVRAEILNTGMGVANPEHLDLLAALCRDGEDGGRVSDSVELRIRTEEEVLARAFRAAEARTLAGPPDPSDDRRTSDLESAGPGTRNRDGAELSPGSDPVDDLSDALRLHDDAKSFHPQVRWYQTLDSVVVTVKLTSPEDQSCEFYPDRVVYRGRLNGRSYRTDLQLWAAVAAGRCRWAMKSGEPVLTLVKRRRESWARLVRSKNIFVSYDAERLEEEEEEEEEEDAAPNGLRFEGDTGEDRCYVDSESGSDSD